jgi:hypothetical protein
MEKIGLLIVITVLDGNPTTRDLKLEFNKCLGTSWQCTTRPLTSNQFTMHFPNPKEVERACYFGKNMETMVCDVVINLSPW